MDDTELEQLLTQLLRVVSPAPAGEPPGPARPAGSAAASVRSDGAGTTAAASNGAPRAAEPSPGLATVTSPTDHPRPPAGGQADIPAVSASEARALIELVSARGIAQGELAGLLSLEKSTVSRLAAGLERKGWIRRGRDEENQRYVRLYLTPEGRAVAGQVWAAWQSRQARILGALSAEERVGLSAGLRGLVRGLAAEGLLADAPAPDQAAPDQAPG
jgi:DNA-binding MarR family transcriptional regulator